MSAALARHARLVAIRQEMDLHPVEKGEHLDPDRDLPLVPQARPAGVPDVQEARVPEARLCRTYQTPWSAR